MSEYCFRNRIHCAQFLQIQHALHSAACFPRRSAIRCPNPPRLPHPERALARPEVELPDDYLVFIHNASWKTKLWPERHWADLIASASAPGSGSCCPGETARRKARAKRLAATPEVQVLPRLNLSEIGYVLAGAKACVCMDTGLAHLAAALDVPAITLYGLDRLGLIGASGASQVHIKSERFCSPCQSKTCRYSSGTTPAWRRSGRDRLRRAAAPHGPALKPVPVSPVSAAARRAS